MEVERVISWFSKDTGRLAGEFSVGELYSLDDLKAIFTPYENDDSMYMVYDVTIKESEKLKDKVSLDFDFDKYNYQLDCFQAGT